MVQLLQAMVEILQTLLDQRLNLPAGGSASVLERQHGGNVVQCETVGLGGTDEPQALEVGGAVDAVVRLRPPPPT